MENQNSVSSTPQNSNRIWIIVGVVVLLCCCLVVLTAGIVFFLNGRSTVSSSIPGATVEGYNGRADNLLKTDTLNAITQYESSQTGCNDVTLLNGTVLTAPQGIGDPWVETWEVNACGESHSYSVTFTPSPQGGTDFSVSPINQ